MEGLKFFFILFLRQQYSKCIDSESLRKAIRKGKWER